MAIRRIAACPARFAAVALLASAFQPLPAAPARALSFAERVAAQEAIERVYYSHQLGTTRPFEEAVPREVLERKVRTYLEESAALERFWGTPVTGEALRRELQRIAAASRFPARLLEIYRALGGDATLIEECFARPVLVDRLARSFFAFDRTIHARARAEADALRDRLAAGVVDPASPEAHRTLVEIRRGRPGRSETPEEEAGPGIDVGPWHLVRPSRAEALVLTPEAFDRARASYPENAGEVGPVVAERERFTIRVVLFEEPDRVRGAIFAVPKVAWDSWWPTVREGLAWEGIPVVADAGDDSVAMQGLEAASTTCIPDDTWTPTSDDPAPLGRIGHSAVWTGSLMVIWGGASSFDYVNTGGRYDPLTDAWTDTTIVGAPPPRDGHQGFWTGDRMIVFGDRLGEETAGGRYDPVADAWAAMSTIGLPAYFFGPPISVWTGRELIVFGLGPSPGSERVVRRYDPQTNLWTAGSTAGRPEFWLFETAVWTGSKVILWGGDNGGHLFPPTSGGLYDPAANTWSSLSTTHQPVGRRYHSAIWTGGKMIVWGGRGVEVGSPLSALNTGGMYDPAIDAWTSTPTRGAPLPRENHSAVWTGGRMIVWGGTGFVGPALDSGGRFDPVTGAWEGVASSGAPSARSRHTAVWTGGEMIVWGGNALPDGGRYALGQSSDLDQDGVTFCAGDCDDLRSATHPGAPEVCDGRDNDCDGSLPPAEADGDRDTSPACADCDDFNSARSPDKPEVCDAIDNDCDSAVDEDDDGDTFTVCNECDDSDATRFPGAPEVNDGRDNQCPGDPGYGPVDEISGSVGFSVPGDTATLCWPAQAGATEYELIRSGQPGLASNCTLLTTASPCLVDPLIPSAGARLSYLVRPSAPFRGSWGTNSAGVERNSVCGVEWACGDGLDNDADGKADCLDLADCFGVGSCNTATLSFTDTSGDDAASSALQDVFSAVGGAPSDHLYLSVAGPSIADFEVCLERADFYGAQYLALAPTDGIATSGSWNKWHRTEGGGWIGPVTTSQDNWFGDSCVGPFSWCPEVGLGGHTLGVAPAEAGVCEAFDETTCSDGTWRFTLRIGVDRWVACGF